MHRKLIILLALLAATAIGCKEPEANKLAIQRMRSVLVVPLDAPNCNPSASSAAAGIAVTRLEQDLTDKQIRVREAPVLWRLKDDARGLTTDEAFALARQMDLQGVLACDVSRQQFSAQTGQEKPQAMQAGQVARYSNAACNVSVSLQLMQVADGEVIYRMTATSDSREQDKQLRSSVNDSLNPLIKIWNSR